MFVVIPIFLCYKEMKSWNVHKELLFMFFLYSFIAEGFRSSINCGVVNFLFLLFSDVVAGLGAH